ncbi:superoxide dismutase family protein [Nocardia cyriacigeorgica]|uniref:Superoxide dismutase [Cu-Zn] n=1 Tax=Nocardia cyriacigeorgica TaxID=135487 RepID=A0ABX0CL40_9NOCA|nr:superoxide dismutase family protein [Nocardia cyriacigeorgica]NEW39628.1 superoxide dismutase family protein [Nocardia cyriacigeorgica]NEW50118.1 superoxide dismutase family protein [Nocardia cyriacigeorgica]NEW57236.1 superoxide dismutase family protein [Nocardia cyriacigeorgica]
MAPSTTRRPSWRTVTPVLAIAVFGLTACTNSQESSDVQGTTPPVWTSSPAPAGTETGHGGGHGGSTGGHGETPAAGGTKVELKDAAGTTVGTADITEAGSFLRISVEANGLRPGFHGLHIHQVGKCEPNSVAPTGGSPGDFLSAGGHLQVGAANSHPASGDLTSLQVREDGNATLVTTTDKVSMADIRGKALMIHADSDNFGNIPGRYTRAGGTGPDEATLATGDAGGRVACGVIQ